MTLANIRKLAIPTSLIAVTAAALVLRAQSTAADRPDATRFTRSVLLDGLNEPMELEFDDAGRVYWSERVNRMIRRLDEATGRVDSLGTIPAETEAETGIIGFLLAPDFSKTKYIYVNYAEPVTPREMRLSRFTLGANDQIDLASEKIMLRWFWEPAKATERRALSRTEWRPLESQHHSRQSRTWHRNPQQRVVRRATRVESPSIREGSRHGQACLATKPAIRLGDDGRCRAANCR